MIEEEIADDGFDQDDPDSGSESDDESECSDDDVAGTMNSIYLDKRVISMFLDTRPATLDIVCRFMFPFCYLCFAFYWWLHYIGKRKNDIYAGCQRLAEQGVTPTECYDH